MPLPILHATQEASSDDLLRLFLKTDSHWAQHLAEETALEVGTAFSNPDLPLVATANQMRDAALPPGMTPAQAVDSVHEHFTAQGTACLQWVINPSAAAEQTQPLVEHLLSRGFTAREDDLTRLDYMPRKTVVEVGGLRIIPARASFRHTRALADEATADQGSAAEQLAEARMLHLDDPHWDALIAIQDGRAVAGAGVLAMGEVGRIEHLFVSPDFRGRGIARTMMSRALEICARSLFKHVLLRVNPADAIAQALSQRFGFRHVGRVRSYLAAG